MAAAAGALAVRGGLPPSAPTSGRAFRWREDGVRRQAGGGEGAGVGRHTTKVVLAARERRAGVEGEGAGAGAAPTTTRRGVLLSAASSGAALAALLLPAQQAAAAGAATFVGRAVGVTFAYPQGWISAIDRDGEGPKERTKATTLCLVGNFKEIDTLSVLRTPLTPELRDAMSQGKAQAVGAALSAESRDAPSTIGFRLLDCDAREGAGGLRYISYEFFVDSCRGQVEEGNGGSISCVGPRDGSLLQTIPRHHLSTAVVAGDFLYGLNGSCTEERWTAMEGVMREAARTFAVAQV